MTGPTAGEALRGALREILAACTVQAVAGVALALALGGPWHAVAAGLVIAALKVLGW